MPTVVIAYGAALAAFLAADAVWLGLIMRKFYVDRLGHVMAASPNFGAAILFYLLFVGGVVFFAIMPAFRLGSLQTAMINGAVLGFIAYGAYDLTNYATLKDWPLDVVIIDMVWGAVLAAVAASVGFLAISRFAPPAA